MRKLQYLSFRETEMCRSQEMKICHFREIEISHFRDIKILQFSGDWNLSCSGDWNAPFLGELCHSRRLKYVIFEILQYFNSREIETYLFGRLRFQFSKMFFSLGIEHDIFGELKGNIFGKGKNWTVHSHKKNCKSKPETKSESKHTWGTTNVDRICHDIQLAS